MGRTACQIRSLVNVPRHMGRLTVKRHSVLALGLGRSAPAVEAKKVSHGMSRRRFPRGPAERVQTLIFELELHNRPAPQIDHYLRGLSVEHYSGPARGLRAGANCGEGG